jgi:hypothetical protein
MSFDAACQHDSVAEGQAAREPFFGGVVLALYLMITMMLSGG